MTSIEGGYISADGHFVEPADLWVERMDKRFRDRAPRVETRADADWYFIDGVTPFPVGLEGASMEDKIAGEIKMMGGRRHATTRPGAWDPQARLVDLTLDHIKAEVMYPGALGLQFWAAQAEVATATAEFHQAELDFYRAKQLFEEQVLSAQRFDQAKTQYDAAQSRLHAKQQQLEEAKKNEVTREREADHARAALGNASASERSEHSLVKQAEAAVREAELNLSYCTMVAPMEGMVSRKAIEVGQRVQPGQALMALLPLHKVYIEANYKETQLTHVRVGQLVEIRADIYPA
jgi:membrane fusion protein (multidrug efflux system)